MRAISREGFIDKFAISIGVHSLRLWHRRSRSAPLHVARSIHEVICMAAGSIPITSATFGEIVGPVIAELHRRTPQGTRPDARELTGLVYDALAKADVDVTIRPPIEAHGR
jgi:hypothetical protein